MPSPIELREITVTFGPRTLFERFDFELREGESVALIGRSGCGKSSLLRLANRLLIPQSGLVLRDGVAIDDANAVSIRRRTGSILQSAALFPHRTVLQNVAVVPRLLGWSEQRIDDEARALLDRVSLPFDRYAARFPRTLSGGEQQRVAIVRALIAGPRLLLCDEPFAALDPLVRRELQDAFIELQRERATTMFFVTHDLPEAMRMGRRVVLIEEGSIRFDGTPAALLENDDPLVARFRSAFSLDAAC